MAATGVGGTGNGGAGSAGDGVGGRGLWSQSWWRAFRWWWRWPSGLAAGTATINTMTTVRSKMDLVSIPTSGLTCLTMARAGITSEDKGAIMAATVAVVGTVAIDKV